MCGFLGVINKKNNLDTAWHASSINSIKYRGPDNTGSWQQKNENIFFYHNRLKIIDLSSDANQPMQIDNNEYSIIFNGEIYNYLYLKDLLESKGHSFKTNSDTEVLIRSYIEWDYNCLNYIEGMFSFGIFNNKKKELFLARDISGEKPLYFYDDKYNFIFGSELKVILNNQKIEKNIDINSLNDFLSLGYFPEEKTIVEKCFKLKPGNYLIYDLKNKSFNIKEYWSLPEFKNKINTNNIEKQTLDLLDESVKKQLVSDVPIGVLLSGGIDSSLITCIASKYVKNIHTFTLKFTKDKKYDESIYAGKIAAHFNTNHHEIEGDKVSVKLLENIISNLDEPIADSSLIATYLISKAVKKHCKVVLGGDGGDELFGGYSQYSRYSLIKLFYVPSFIKRIISNFSKKYLPLGFAGSNIRTWLIALNTNFRKEIPNTYPFFDSFNKKKLLETKVLEQVLNLNAFKNYQLIRNEIIQSTTRTDFKNYLANDILVKVDRSSMLNSIELRSPFLDKKLIEFAFSSIPSKLKANYNDKKIMLKSLCKKLFPKDYDFKRKQGFSVPIGDLFRTDEWKDYINSVLIKNSSSLFNKEYIKMIVNSHINGKNNSERIFLLLVLIRWINLNQIKIKS